MPNFNKLILNNDEQVEEILLNDANDDQIFNWLKDDFKKRQKGSDDKFFHFRQKYEKEWANRSLRLRGAVASYGTSYIHELANQDDDSAIRSAVYKNPAFAESFDNEHLTIGF